MQETWTPETMWLLITNIILVILVLIPFIVIMAGVIVHLLSRRKEFETDSHAVKVPGLGLTMADGGDKIENESVD